MRWTLFEGSSLPLVRRAGSLVFFVSADQGGCCPTFHLSQGARGVSVPCLLLSLPSHLQDWLYFSEKWGIWISFSSLLSDTDFRFQKNGRGGCPFQQPCNLPHLTWCFQLDSCPRSPPSWLFSFMKRLLTKRKHGNYHKISTLQFFLMFLFHNIDWKI